MLFGERIFPVQSKLTFGHSARPLSFFIMKIRTVLACVLATSITFAPLSTSLALGLPPADTVAPILSAVSVQSVATTLCTIAWTTNEASDAQIDYGTTSGYGLQTTLDISLGLAHVVAFAGLMPGTVYHFRVRSQDAVGNSAIGDDRTCTTEAAPVSSSSTSSSSSSSISVDAPSSSSSSLHVEVSSTASTQTDIITNPITTASSSSASSIDPVFAANPDAYGPVISNITINSVTTAGAVVAWTTDEIADSQIEYGLTDTYGFETALSASLGTAHLQTFTDLQVGTTYHLRVKSKDTAGNVTISEDHVFTTESAPLVADTPPVILAQGVASVTSSSVLVLWTTDEIASSQIEYGLTTDYGSHTALDASLGLEHAVTINDLTPGATYHYRIKTTSSAGQTTYSGDDTFTMQSITVTVEPSAGSSSSSSSISLVASEIEAGTLTANEALIIWTTSAPADAEVEYGLTTRYGSHTTIDASLGLAHGVLIDTLQPATTYHYRIKSHDALGNLVTSEDHTFTTLAAAPSTITLSTPPVIEEAAVSTEVSTATITWTTNELANSQIEYGLTSSYGSQSTLNGAFALTHTVFLTDLEPNTTYHYRIRTADAGGRLTMSSEATFATAASLGGSSVTLPSLGDTETSALTASSALITWMTSVPTDAQIDYGLTTSYGSHSTIDTSLSLEHSITLSGLSADTTYHYRVRSVDASGNHVVSPDETFTTLELPTDQTAPVLSSVTVTRVGTSSATVTWTTDDASTARVQYGETTAYGVFTDLDPTPGTTHSATITGLFPDTAYHFNVQSDDSAGNRAISVDQIFRTQAAPFTSGEMSTPVVSHVTDTSITLSWTVPFDDSAGTEFYDIRSSTAPITQYNFDEAVPAREGVEHIVHVGGQSTEHIYLVIDLQPGTSYYFGIKSGASRSTLAHLEETQSNLSAEVRTQNEESSATGVTGNTPHTLSQSHADNIQSRGGSTHSPAGEGSNGGSRRMPVPRNVQARAADGEVAFVWTSPLRSPFIHTDIVRKEGSFPSSPTDGVTVYDGRDENFTDTNLTNGKKYHYAVFTHNDGAADHSYSRSILVAMLPTDGVEQFDFHVATSPVAPTHTNDLKLGMRGNAVSDLQKMLAKNPSLYPEGMVTGYFGSLTQAAVKKLQQKHGLPQTGVFDAVTRDALGNNAMSTSSTISQNMAEAQRDLLQGTRGDDVRMLQTFLKSQGLYTIDVTGYFGEYTLAGVKEFQKQQKLRVTGAVSTLTWGKIREIQGR